MTEHEKNGLMRRLIYFWPFIMVAAGAVAFWAKTDTEMAANTKWHDECQRKVDTHETRLSVMEGKIDQIINLQREILRHVR